jgi:protein-S-isoprenylcysteine O-methyltransferase Ste14
MKRRDDLRIAHIISTAWFIICVGYILVLALRQAGFHWWVVFSISGQGALIILLLVSLYLFAIFRGISSSQKVQVEHPLTSTIYYTGFYVSAPFLGCLSGLLGMIGTNSVSQFLLGIAMGTLGTTFLVWVIVDPLIGLLEMILPASRKHRAQRVAQAKAERDKKQKARVRLLEDVLEKEESDRLNWQEVLKPQAEKLAGLLTAEITDLKQVEQEAVGIGVSAWQTGGLSCMRELRDMAIALSNQKYENKAIVDYINFWWDGIGNWRAAPLG